MLLGKHQLIRGFRSMPKREYAWERRPVKRWPIRVRLWIGQMIPDGGWRTIGRTWSVVCPGPRSLRYVEQRLAELVADLDGTVVIEEDTEAGDQSGTK
jgi:hypothetical protein